MRVYGEREWGSKRTDKGSIELLIIFLTCNDNPIIPTWRFAGKFSQLQVSYEIKDIQTYLNIGEAD